ncbi:MAG: malto-oligosyltrehalose trehalohydrolase, partial [Flavisolibacter sp.]|nr:malto-oligosyltrehalose trehalohydrolase [Flavisolibacter sp.]
MRWLAAEKRDNKTVFTVWAPLKKSMILHLVHPYDRQLPMTKDEEGYWQVEVNDLPDDARYFFMPDGEKDYPDPASRFQPAGVHGPSQVVNHALYRWNDQGWKAMPLEEMILYELHVGTFTPKGTFEAIIPRLDDLKAIGINALQLMPISQFPGNRNWGYDGTFPYAVQNSYGGPEGLKKLVDTCHQKGIAVLLDVVYNHIGPEGNYFSRLGPYFTNKYCTPWGDALNFDGDWSDGVRDYFSDNALYWFEHFHIDGLRCDAIHMVFDNGAVHFWELTHHKVKEWEEKLGRPFYLIAESDLNSPKVIKTPEAGGYGFTAQWLDDFHHALYVLLNKEDKERYYDFGRMEQLAKAYTDGFVLSGEWVKFRKRKYGTSSAGMPGNKFIVFTLNHDQVGNRVKGERLCMLVNFERAKLAAAAIMLSPYIPMLFMGEEYGDDTPFYYFVSHSDPALVEAVRKGRKEEFKDFGFDVEPPDPQDEKTFNDSKINWDKRKEGRHKILLQWHEELIRLRKTLSVLKNFEKKDIQVQV